MKFQEDIIEHIVVITGPTSAGKSTLARIFLKNRLPELNKHLGILPQGWAYISAIKAHKIGETVPTRLVLHYDFLRPLKGKVLSYQVDPALEFLKKAHKISIVTIWTPSKRLLRQHSKNEIQVYLHLWKYAPNSFLKILFTSRVINFVVQKGLYFLLPGAIPQLKLEIQKIYYDPNKIIELYCQWFNFCDKHIRKVHTHLVVEFDKELTFISRNEWDRKVCAILNK